MTINNVYKDDDRLVGGRAGREGRARRAECAAKSKKKPHTVMGGRKRTIAQQANMFERQRRSSYLEFRVPKTEHN